MEGSFADENNREINKIKVIPRRTNEPAFEGYIYIVEESYAIYAVDLTIKGVQIQNPALNSLSLKQSLIQMALVENKMVPRMAQTNP